ncbi:MAG: hypothetical protein KA969_08380, partial [Alicycliphilus sp.]|nr:hypothetical protein [Alicycliphilus sp.]
MSDESTGISEMSRVARSPQNLVCGLLLVGELLWMRPGDVFAEKPLIIKGGHAIKPERFFSQQ